MLIRRLLLCACLAAVASLVPVASAAAEQCVPSQSGKRSICMVTDISQPIPPATGLRFRVPAGASNVEPTYARLIEAGPPGGTDTYEAELIPPLADQAEEIQIAARVKEPCQPVPESPPYCPEEALAASFVFQALAPAAHPRLTISHSGRGVVATYSFDARTEITAELELTLHTFRKKEALPLLHRHLTRTVGPGAQAIRLVLPRRLVARKCRQRKCSVLVTAFPSIARSVPSQYAGLEAAVPSRAEAALGGT